MNKKLSKKDYISIYEYMLTIRRFEERAAQLYGMGHIGGFCHLYIGQECIISGIESLASEDDCFITGYRCHSHMVSRGESLLLHRTLHCRQFHVHPEK